MKLFDVYPRFDIHISRGFGTYVYDEAGTEYLDLYGGHAVISVGHSHPHYINRISEQLSKIGFYSNSVQMPIQDELAQKLGTASGYPDYQLFLVNSGAEAIENALKLASFNRKRYKVVAFDKAFHGRTSAAVQVTDNPKIQAPLNRGIDVIRLPLNDVEALQAGRAVLARSARPGPAAPSRPSARRRPPSAPCTATWPSSGPRSRSSTPLLCSAPRAPASSSPRPRPCGAGTPTSGRSPG